MPGDAASIEIARLQGNAMRDAAALGADASIGAANIGADASRYGTNQSTLASMDAQNAATARNDASIAGENARNTASIAGMNARNDATNATTIEATKLYPKSLLSPNTYTSSSPNKPGLAHGIAKVPGQGDGTVDTVDAKLAPGEAVLNKAAAEMLGRGLIDLLNKHGMLRMGMPDPREEADEPEGYACGTSNVKGYATGTAYVEPLAVQRAPVPAAPTFTLGMMGGNQGAPAIGGGGWADPGAIENTQRHTPRPMMVPPPAAQPISPIPTIDHGPAPSTPDQSATAWGNRPAPAPAAPPVNTGWSDPGAQENSWRHTAGQAPAPAAPGASAPPPRMINGMTGVVPQGIGAPGQRPTMPAPAPSPITNDMSFDQAFKAARDAFGGAGGQFDWHGKSYQTNVKGENYAKTPKSAF